MVTGVEAPDVIVAGLTLVTRTWGRVVSTVTGRAAVLLEMTSERASWNSDTLT